jgi:hypothetical protein
MRTAPARSVSTTWTRPSTITIAQPGSCTRIIREPVGDDDRVDWWQRGALSERGDRRVR